MNRLSMKFLSGNASSKYAGDAPGWINDRRYQKLVAEALLWLLLLTLPFWFNAIGGYTALGTRVLVMALAAMSVNFLLGYTGVLSMGHAAYFGLGAYGAGLIIKYVVPSTLAGMAAGVIVALVAGALIGLLIIHLRCIYFAMVTIAFGQVFYFLAFRWNNVTGGDDGLSNWTRLPIDFGFAKLDILHYERAFYYFTLFFFIIAVAIMAGLLLSPFGRTLLAIRENERRARFLGIPVDRHIWISWIISCGFCGLAGTLYAFLNNFVSPHDLRWDQFGVFVLMAVLGGMRSFWGPLVGATIYVVFQDVLSSHTQNWMSFIGLSFVLIVLFCPRGILGLFRRKHKS